MTWVTIDGRRFIVDFDGAGQPLRIKERKKKNPGHPYLEIIIDAPYWHAGHHRVGKPTSVVARILAAATLERKEP